MPVVCSEAKNGKSRRQQDNTSSKGKGREAVEVKVEKMSHKEEGGIKEPILNDGLLTTLSSDVEASLADDGADDCSRRAVTVSKLEVQRHCSFW